MTRQGGQREGRATTRMGEQQQGGESNDEGGGEHNGRPIPKMVRVVYYPTSPHPSLANARRRGSHFHSTPRDGEGFPSLSRLFDFIRHEEEGRPFPSCPFDVLRCDKAPNTRSVPIWAYSWCSCPLHLTRHVKHAQMGTFYVSGVVSNTEHQKHARFGVFLCSAPSQS